jgi:hypothetical protein
MSMGECSARFAVSQYRPCSTAKDGSTEGETSAASGGASSPIAGSARCAAPARRSVALGALSRHQRRLEQLPDDAEGELALELGPARGQHGEALALGLAADRANQRRLADPRRPLDEQAAAGTASGRAEHLCGLPELRAPLEQGSHARSRNHSQVQLYLSGCPSASVWAWPARETSSRASAGSG